MNKLIKNDHCIFANMYALGTNQKGDFCYSAKTFSRVQYLCTTLSQLAKISMISNNPSLRKKNVQVFKRASAAKSAVESCIFKISGHFKGGGLFDNPFWHNVPFNKRQPNVRPRSFTEIKVQSKWKLTKEGAPP